MTSARFRLLPVEATEAMILAMEEAFHDPTDYANASTHNAWRAALSAAPVLAEATGWQPIETAPKDGTHILAFGVRGAASPPTTVHWFGPPDLPGLRSGRWYISVQQDEGGRVYPTHWQPLPPDPPALNAALAIAAGQLGEKET